MNIDIMFLVLFYYQFFPARYKLIQRVKSRKFSLTTLFLPSCNIHPLIMPAGQTINPVAHKYCVEVRFAVVTGSNMGIGRAIAKILAGVGTFSDVILGCRDKYGGVVSANKTTHKLSESESPRHTSF